MEFEEFCRKYVHIGGSLSAQQLRVMEEIQRRRDAGEPVRLFIPKGRTWMWAAYSPEED